MSVATGLTPTPTRPDPAGAADEQRGSEFAVLCRRVRAAGLLDRRHSSYAIRITATLAAYLAAWVVFAALGSSWWQLLVAVALGVVFTQVAFLGHDGGHQQILRARLGNDLVCILAGNLLVGLSFGWWVDKHNRHHANPNHEGIDPDIASQVLAFTDGQIADRRRGPTRFLAAHQATLFFPLLTLEGLNLHVASIGFLFSSRRGRRRRYRTLETVLFCVHTVAYLGALLVVLGPLKALAFFAVHQAVFGVYMGCSFAPNHKGMPTVAAGEKLDFLRRQVLTSRNIRGGWFTDQLLGGLNYQIEHHLFPNLPRANLKAVRSLVKAHCLTHQIHYSEASLLGSYAIVVRHLHALGRPLRERAVPAAAQ